MHKFAFFPTDSENEQSVVSFNLDISIDINALGAKPNISVHSVEGVVDMKNFKNIFSKLYIAKTPREIQNFISFIESNWRNLSSSYESSLEKIINDFKDCSEVDNTSKNAIFLLSN